MRGRPNEATRPHSYHLAKLGHMASHGLRGAGLYALVDLAKKAGLKPLFFGNPAARVPPSKQDEAFLRSILKDEL